MRFISMHDGFGVLVQGGERTYFANGLSQETTREIAAYFKPEGLRPHEREAALAKFSFRGLYQEMDEATTVQPDYRLGVFDSVVAQQQNGWSDEERELVEQRLLADAENYNEILVAPTSSVPPPWPNYDAYQGTPKKLMAKLISDGHDLQQTLTYERETQNRAVVVELLERLLVDPSVVSELAPSEEVVVG